VAQARCTDYRRGIYLIWHEASCRCDPHPGVRATPNTVVSLYSGKFIFADAGYRGQKTAAAIAKTGTWKLTIVQRNELHRFVVLPKRWIVERTLAWISHSRRLARDFERYARSAAAFIRLAMIRIMLRRLTNPTLCS
jgi:transposase